MKAWTKVLLGSAVLLGGAFLAARVAAERPRPVGQKARLRMVEQHFSDLATSTATLEEQVRTLAAHVAALEARLEQCGCPPPPPPCLPCQQQGLCTPEGTACGKDVDGDGTDDCLDRCPCEPGSPDQGGCQPPPCELCPCTADGQTCGHDADGDGLDDCSDRCPCEAGSPENGGCPRAICEPCASCQLVPCGHDADGDGIDDCADGCPCEPGTPETHGCPSPPPPPCDACLCIVFPGTCGHDADGDGIDDCSDRCPCDAGPPESGGCPRPICEPCASCQLVPCGHDADGDGVDDCEDACPCRPGVPENKGCPAGTPCQTDADCDDVNPCSLDVCIEGVCEHKCLCLAADGFDCGPGPLRE